TETNQVVGLVPQHIVNANLERALGSGGCWRGQVRERRLKQSELLQFLAAISAAKHFVLRFAMCCLDDITVNLYRRAIVRIGQLVREQQRGSQRSAGIFDPPLVGLSVARVTLIIFRHISVSEQSW